MSRAAPTLANDALDARLACAGPVAARFSSLCTALQAQPHLPAELIELCRLLLARMHRLPATPLPGVDGAKAAAVLAGQWADEPLLGSAETAVLNFAELYALDPQSITDEVAARVVGHFGEPGLVALIESLGFADGRIRAALLLDAIGE